MDKPVVRISVRNLVEFILRSGDLDNRGGSSDREAMQKGSRLHRKIQGRMGSHYRAEVSLKYKTEYNAQVEGENLTLYAKYSRRDVCRLLNWPNDDSSTLYGYRVKHNTCPIFVTYDKKEDISDSTKYLDEFVNRDVFSWMTRSRLKLDSKEVVAIKNYQKTNLKIHLFIKKSDDEGKDFYYMGQVEPFDFIQTTIKSKDGDLPIANIKYNLHIPVKDELYDYFENKI